MSSAVYEPDYEILDSIGVGSTVPVKVGTQIKQGRVVSISQCARSYVVRILDTSYIVKVPARVMVQTLRKEE